MYLNNSLKLFYDNELKYIISYPTKSTSLPSEDIKSTAHWIRRRDMFGGGTVHEKWTNIKQREI
jgi:hypothetical protein